MSREDFVTYTCTAPPMSVVDQLRAMRDCASDREEELLREGARDIAVTAECSLATIDAILLEFEDRDAELARWAVTFRRMQRTQNVLFVLQIILGAGALLIAFG